MSDHADTVAGAQAARAVKLVDALIQGWSASAPVRPEGAGKAQSVPQRAYLLFNRWEDNLLAHELSAQFPKWPRDRVAVPDRYFEHRLERAPCLLELPEELVDPALGVPARALRDWLAHCLTSTALQVNDRTPRQDFCGVVFSPASAQAIVRHWVQLGDQRPPYEEDRVLFRYHDPRVMQRVWPALSPAQQSRWLGPVTQWWSLRQPWGPFAVLPEPAHWFQAKASAFQPGTDAGGSLRDLFDESQWFLSGVSPDANMIWRGYADADIPPEVQPDAQSMVAMLADGVRLGLQDFNLEDYVWTTWMHAPAEGTARAMDWSLPHLAPILSRLQAQLRDQPDARFSTLLSQNINSKQR